MYSFPLERTQFLEFFLIHRRVPYGIPVEAEAFQIESNLVGSIPSEDIVTGDPVIISLTPNMAFKSANL